MNGWKDKGGGGREGMTRVGEGVEEVILFRIDYPYYNNNNMNVGRQGWGGGNGRTRVGGGGREWKR